ncbi:hypothetical protein R0J91_12385, partial [Micrococcus sp. SIMBA_131]
TNCGPWGRAIGSHSSTIGRWHENIVITGNFMEDLNHWGVRAYSWENVVIANNFIENCGGGIAINPPDTGDSKDTEDTSGNVTGASQTCKNVTITNNKIKGGGSYGNGISVSGESTGVIDIVSIIGNLFENCGGI